MTLQLQVTERDTKENLDTLRDAGKIPAIFYGPGKDAVSITLDEKAFIKAYREGGETTVIELTGAGNGTTVLIQDIQVHVVTGKVLHVDFKIVEANVAIVVTVPIEFIGESPVEKSGTGTVTKVLQELEIEALPAAIPQSIEVDISVLANMDDMIAAKDLALPQGATLQNDPEDIVATIAALQEEVEGEEAGEIDFDAIQVETKGKTEASEEAAE